VSSVAGEARGAFVPAAGGSTVAADALGAGLSWSWELDFETLLAALSEPAPWNRPLHQEPEHPAYPVAATAADAEPAGAEPAGAEPATPTELSDLAEAELADLLDAAAAGQSRLVPLGAVAGRVAEALPPGPDLAGWLATSSLGQLEDGALAGVAASYRRLASWAQAGELAVVAEMVSRSAAADCAIGVDPGGRPVKVPEDASGQVSLALVMSQCAALMWTDLAVTLRWRLAATGVALRAGEIDLGRARLIADATSFLADEVAQAVEGRVLPRAGQQTMAQLRAALRRAVIAADPKGADRRREEAERRAKVSLYPDQEGTASLAGYSLPGTRAAAAMARISALARAMKAAGASGGLDLLRAHVFLGLLLGTLPYIPPAQDGPPDDPPGPPDSPADSGLGADDDPGPVAPADESDSDDDLRLPWCHPSGPDEADDYGPDSMPPPAWPEIPSFLPPWPPAMSNLRPAAGGLLDLTLPWATLAGESAEPGHLSRIGPITPAQASHLALLATLDATVRWRVIVTDEDGKALAVTWVRRDSARAGPASRGDPPGSDVRGKGYAPAGGNSPADSDASGSCAGLICRVTVAIPRNALAQPLSSVPPIAARVLGAAVKADEQAEADDAAAVGCTHAGASRAYRPPPRLQAHVVARDVTCRFPTCRQPAWRCDIDHTIPFDRGGLTCRCNLGGLCRTHHQIKQHPRWRLDQPAPGSFVWTTPAGRRYLSEPDRHVA
jgi:hypothetical protein